MTGHPKIPLAGVIGHPIAHSRSPVLHGYWLGKYGIRGHYIPMDVAEEDLESVLRALPKAGFVGCNITIPHKERALELADAATETAARIGAANTLTFTADGEIHADNTDGYGFTSNLLETVPSWNPASGPAVVIGAGGASRAIVDALLQAGCPELRVVNRTRSRADVLRDEFGDKLRVFDWGQTRGVMEGAKTVVNTTSLGMTGKEPFDLSLDGLESDAVVTDCVYTPLQTGLLLQAAAMGCVTVDGLGMLLHQAVPGFERWFGLRPGITSELRNAVLCA